MAVMIGVELWIRDAIELVSLVVLIYNSFLNRYNIKKIEIATNSMKDALVLTTEKEALLRGHAKGVADRKEEERVL